MKMRWLSATSPTQENFVTECGENTKTPTILRYYLQWELFCLLGDPIVDPSLYCAINPVPLI